MEYLSVVVAAAASFAFGAFWYSVFAKPWMADVGMKMGPDGTPEGYGKAPFVLAGIAMLLVAGMMRHTFALSGIDTLGEGVVSGLGIGLFFISPWIMINNGYAGRPFRLTLIDGGYASFGCALMGLVLTLF
ncbi:MAG: DUF1761 domain-containing protein [Sulfitobacter sp.]|nr:DUF1761 domain-containing protein [Sulfitobacter sp.]